MISTAAPRPTPPVSFVRARQVLNGGTSLGVQSNVATTVRVLGNATGGGTIAGPTPQGIGPSPSIAADNTLSAFYPYQGRIYVTYVDRVENDENPADNTDVYLRYSDNGGVSWINAGRVDDDNGRSDGFSEATDFNAGRPQFQPEVTVDSGTGTLLISFYDTRNDASRGRAAQYLAASMDGGATFAPQTFVNQPESVFDVATGQTRVVGPIPDNESGGNPNSDGTFGYGTRQGLVALNGNVYVAWSGNENGGPDGKAYLDIRVARATYAAGPRIVSGTSGVVTTTDASGTPQAQQFDVTFDRPVDPLSFTGNDITVIGKDANGNTFVTFTGANITVTRLDGNARAATQFRVSFPPQTTPGTYSYAVGPDINDLISTVSTVVSHSGPPIAYDAATLDPTQVNLRIPSSGTGGTDNGGDPNNNITRSNVVVSGSPAGVITDVNVGLNLAHTFDPDLVITLISPTGKRILLSANNGFNTSPVGQNYTNTLFDDQATTPIAQGLAPFTGSFSPQGVLSDLIGDQPNGTWTLEIDDTLAIDTGTLLDWSLQIQVGTVTTSIVTGVPMDQNANGIPGEAGVDSFAAPQSSSGIPFTTPFVRDTLPLIVPGPRVVSTQVVNATGSLGLEHNLVLNGTVGAFDVTFDRDMDPSTFTKDDVLRIEGPEGVVDPASYTVTSIDARTFRIGFALEQLSGTYQLTIGSDIRSAVGNYAVDTNQNAGMDALRGGSLADPTLQVTFASADVPKAVAAATTSGSTVTPQVVSSTIKIDDSFTIRDLNLQLNVQRSDQTKPAEISKLKVELVAPDGTTILLFANLKNTTGQAAFTDTILDDQADLSIDQGGPAFTSSFKPESFLGDLNGSNSLLGPNGTVPSGVYTLRITNSDSNAWTLNSWSLTFQKPVPGTGLGEPVADRIAGELPDLHDGDPTNPLASSTWTAVGPASIDNGGACRPDRRPGGRPVRPVGQHRLRRRRQRRRLEDDQLPDDRPAGPDLHPADRLRPDLRHQHRRDRRLRPQQRPEPVDRLRRHRRGRHRHPRASGSSGRWTAARPGPAGQHRQHAAVLGPVGPDPA